ncbi:histidine--tRNA ligase [Buchnera aphidicola]|uniref:histidine--tRNA ligase n=1 Tax=Buchnera aphidicola TaxID=9 RepID=UPI00209219BA|nr:histidine--tRNA ligase [Buchnera aphidicola]USS94318.1 histidine--tRNA ligase [Buchnera aphidicola (Sipha maydis)]
MIIKRIQSVKGMHDYLPEELNVWNTTESVLKKIFKNYGYCEIRLPILEKTKLFTRSIGEITDIIEKEMYTFNDRNKKSLTLRPESTTCCVRAILENNLLKNIKQRFWYFGPMFRYEKPQKGRYRQFYQFGCEIYGLSNPKIELELILLLNRIWKILKISNNIYLEINSIGTITARERYKDDLINYLISKKKFLDLDSQNRLYKNPLRILDSKNKNTQNILKNAPVLLDYLDENSINNFNFVCNSMKKIGISFKINKNLIRGLDYYNDIVFEWKTKIPKLGSQNTICAGGRYDKLIQILGGPKTPALGCAIGMERLIAIINAKKNISREIITDIYIISTILEENVKFIQYIEKIRKNFFQLSIVEDLNIGSVNKKIIRARKFKPKIILLINDVLFEKNMIEIKYFDKKYSKIIPMKDIIFFLKSFF